MQLLNTLETSGDATSVLDSAEQLISEFGADNVGGAYQNLTLAKFLAALKSLISDNPSLSEPVKEMAFARIDAAAAELGADASPGATEAVGSDDAMNESADADMQSMMNDLMLAIAAQNDEDNGAGSTEGRKNSKSSEGEAPSNWLEKLAEGLAEVQSKWLDKADKHLETMNSEADSEDSKAFTTAQSKYSAAMQMFSMSAAASSTSIKSVGEGLAGIARKQ